MNLKKVLLALFSLAVVSINAALAAIIGDADRQKLLACVDYRIGLEAFEQEDYPKAVEYYQKALKSCGDNDFIRHDLARLLILQDKANEARVVIEKCVRRLPKIKNDEFKGMVLGIYGLALIGEGDVSSGINELRKSVSVSPTAANFCALGRIYSAMDSFSEARDAFNSALKADSSFCDVYDDLAELYLGHNDVGEALSCYESLIKCSPSISAFLGRVGCLAGLGRTQEAIDVLIPWLCSDEMGNDSSSMQTFSGNAVDQARVIVRKLSSDSLPLVLASLRMARQMTPGFSSFPMFMAEAYGGGRQFLESAVWYKYALDSSPYLHSFAPAIFSPLISSCYSEIFQADSALAYLQRCKDFRTDIDGGAIVSAFERAGLLDSALFYARKYAEAEPNTRAPLLALAPMLALDGKLSEAEAVYSLLASDSYLSGYVNLARVYRIEGDEKMVGKTIKTYFSKLKADSTTDLCQVSHAWALVGSVDSVDAVVSRVLSRDSSAMTVYRLACAYGLLGNVAKSVSLLNRSIKSGFMQFHVLDHDTDFRSIANAPEMIAVRDHLKKAQQDYYERLAAEEARIFSQIVAEMNPSAARAKSQSKKK